ncbi:protein of unknown function [Taphrina deformans PYCC 5710]|uniref:NuBaID C-terminal domain-containing protein n=1 Tax=Taphrina deformans (strain PYCC 5710 / ATCC 11124 / CBS 356.35 / IMI 108563 / JCM 9778 / NBRC 8474) TaxID=1097556 RepID=R4XI36_TAPDE|nr:protein of unknown function [Taphrina deformans PYCC 5710]|eukprot:CCG83062.1 protein of unknown function [Taphrina deformans PYCC 5710]
MSLDAFARRVHSFEDAGEDEQKVLRHTGRGVEVPDDFRGLDTVALLGWSFSKQGTLALLVCQDCHRRLRLPANGSLDAWEEHYDYCPWHWKKANAPDVVAQAHDGQVVVPLEDKDSREQVRQVRQKLGFV